MLTKFRITLACASILSATGCFQSSSIPTAVSPPPASGLTPAATASPTPTPNSDVSMININSIAGPDHIKSSYEVSLVGGSGDYEIVSHTCTNIATVGDGGYSSTVQGDYVGPGDCVITVTDGSTELEITLTSTNNTSFQVDGAPVVINSVQAATTSSTSTILTSYNVGLIGGSENYSIVGHTCSNIATVAMGEYNMSVTGSYVGPGTCTITVTDGSTEIEIPLTSTNDTSFRADFGPISVNSIQCDFNVNHISTSYHFDLVGGSGSYEIVSHTCANIVSVNLVDYGVGVSGDYIGTGNCTITLSDGDNEIEVPITSTNNTLFELDYE